MIKMLPCLFQSPRFRPPQNHLPSHTVHLTSEALKVIRGALYVNFSKKNAPFQEIGLVWALI